MSRNAIRFVHRRPKHGVSAAAAVVLALIAWPSFAHASPQSAEKAYQKGDFTAAEQQYQAAAAQKSGAPQLEFNVGAAAYKAGMFDDAAKAFQKSLTTDQLNLQQETYYNLGNTQYRLGQKTEKTTPEQTIPVWKQAIQSYDAAIQLNSNDADSIYNRDLVKKQLDRLQQQQQHKQQNKDNKDNTDQKNKDQSSQDQKSQSGNNQDQKNPSQNQSQAQNQAPNQAKQQEQSNSDQKNQGEPKPDQNGQGQKNQDQQQQAGKQPNQAQPDQSQAGQPKPDAGKDQMPQQTKAGDQTQSPKPNGQRQAGAQPQKDGSQASAQAPPVPNPVPGQMTPEEAKALLNSLKGDEHRLPAAPIGRNQPSDDNTPPAKDW